jgi:hypothetical protein
LDEVDAPFFGAPKKEKRERKGEKERHSSQLAVL